MKSLWLKGRLALEQKIRTLRAALRTEFYRNFGDRCGNTDCGKRMLPEERRFLRPRIGPKVCVCKDCYAQVHKWDSQVKR